MKLTVLIERDPFGLTAHVMQEGRKGPSLLRRGIKNITSAKLQIQKRLQADTGQWVEITWEGVQQ